MTNGPGEQHWGLWQHASHSPRTGFPWKAITTQHELERARVCNGVTAVTGPPTLSILQHPAPTRSPPIEDFAEEPLH